MHWLDQRHTVPLIQQLNAQADQWRAVELARARKLLAKGESVEAVLETLSRGLTQKMLHGAMAELHGSQADQLDSTAQTVSRMFLRGQAPRDPNGL
jgi:glutamyl-tRNA reductase